MFRAFQRVTPRSIAVSSCMPQLPEQARRGGAGIFEVRQVETLCEPAVDGFENLAGFLRVTLIAPETCQARSRLAIQATFLCAALRKPSAAEAAHSSFASA